MRSSKALYYCYIHIFKILDSQVNSDNKSISSLSVFGPIHLQNGTINIDFLFSSKKNMAMIAAVEFKKNVANIYILNIIVYKFCYW